MNDEKGGHHDHGHDHVHENNGNNVNGVGGHMNVVMGSED